MAKFQKKVQKYKSIVPPPPERPKPSRAALDALVEVATIAACIDGELGSGEARALATQILATPGFDKLDGEALGRTVEAIALQVAAEGIPARVKAIARAIGNDIETREEAFALATLFVLFDGEVGDEEQELLELLQRELHISDERAAHINSLLADDGV
jgi:tellurite resistance protein